MPRLESQLHLAIKTDCLTFVGVAAIPMTHAQKTNLSRLRDLVHRSHPIRDTTRGGFARGWKTVIESHRLCHYSFPTAARLTWSSNHSSARPASSGCENRYP